MLDRADRRDSRYIQSHLHKLAMGLMEVTCISRDSRHLTVNVRQHSVVLRLVNSQSRVDVADD